MYTILKVDNRKKREKISLSNPILFVNILENSSFIDWEYEIEELMNEEHENALRCVGEDELPY